MNLEEKCSRIYGEGCFPAEKKNKQTNLDKDWEEEILFK